ncbi:MAG TPA: DUF3137 domain-containing protein [Bacteroidales bacterium]|nr:DUF3137 domain-containing protein [Bacteroidales bacterium]HQM70699.1 DUF3137 domain-containing protein [Bacteroidales bacterium]
MTRYKNFREFYETSLKPDLEIIDRDRKKVNKRALTIISATVAAVILEIVLIPSAAEMLKGFIPMITGFAGLVSTGIVSKNYRKEYKSKIIAKITSFLDEGMVYTPEAMVPVSEFIKSDIFSLSVDSYTGEDHFRGKIGKTDIEFSEVTAKHLNTTQSNQGSKQEYITIFSGVFVIADFNKNFLTQTLVLPDTAEKLFGKFGQTLQSIGAGKKKLVRLENPEFEKEFCVYGEDQVEARYIITPSLMERILIYKRKWKSKISLSFVDSKVYLAINMNKNLFETRIFRPVADYSFMEENLRFLILLTEIVEDLNLNTRIWTKE